MLIASPPPPNFQSNLEFGHVKTCVTALDNSLHKQFQDPRHPCRIEDRYFTQFEWFKDSIPRTDRILNVGCSYGRETFSLLWCLTTKEVVGVDNELQGTMLKLADLIRTLLAALPKKSLEYLDSSPENKQEFQQWYENQVPSHIRQGARLHFYNADISSRDSFNEPDDYFDLVYSRYVLDKIWKKDGETGVLMALRTMSRLVKPLDSDGRVVIVMPTQPEKEIEPNQFQRLLAEAGLTLHSKKDEHVLGYLECPDTHPKGYICSRS